MIDLRLLVPLLEDLALRREALVRVELLGRVDAARDRAAGVDLGLQVVGRGVVEPAVLGDEEAAVLFDGVASLVGPAGEALRFSRALLVLGNVLITVVGNEAALGAWTRGNYGGGDFFG